MQKKKASPEKNPKQGEKYMWAVVDGVKEKVSFLIACVLHFFWDRFSYCDIFLSFQVGNFSVEPPGLFRGRGEHPKVAIALFFVHA